MVQFVYFDRSNAPPGRIAGVGEALLVTIGANLLGDALDPSRDPARAG